MSSQRKLNAILFELQTASSPLAQAKILARSWRTLRELSATDRRLLARHAGFDGAEQILEGLARKQIGFAPASLLQVLDRARSTDGATVTELLAAVRDPSRRDEIPTRGVDLAADLLGDDDSEDDPREIGVALDQLQAVERDDPDSPEEAVAALDERMTAGPPVSPPSENPVLVPPPEANDQNGPEMPGPPPSTSALPTETVETPPKAAARPAPKPLAPLPGWDRLGALADRTHVEPLPSFGPERLSDASAISRLDTLAVFAALESEASSLARLRALDSEMGGLQGAGLGTIRDILDAFPAGWPRRRALAAMISAHVPASADRALELIAGLEREVDRRWCLGSLARRGDLEGEALERSLELVSSPAGRRRLQIIAANS